jgi:DNA-binding NarL/FixJ family response regulator
VRLGLQPDVDLAVLDVSMPRMTGLQAARELSRRRPELRVLMLSHARQRAVPLRGAAAGASGYVLKTSADRDLVEACRAPCAASRSCTRAPCARSMRDSLERAARRGPAGRPAHAARDEIVKLIAEAHTTREIAEMLVISREDRRAPPHATSSPSSACATASTRSATRAGRAACEP